MSASNFCCTHPQQRTDSPEPPPRPLASIDGIFAAAALPEDHPHAMKFLERSKPELDPSIVRSPNIASKIKLQFGRKSMKNLSKEKEYDEDAHRLTSQAVLCDVEETAERTTEEEDVAKHARFGSVLDLGKIKPPVGTEVRPSVFRSLEYLKPLLHQSVSAS